MAFSSPSLTTPPGCIFSRPWLPLLPPAGLRSQQDVTIEILQCSGVVYRLTGHHLYSSYDRVAPPDINPACGAQCFRYAGFCLLILKAAFKTFLLSSEYLPPDSLHAAHTASVTSGRSEKRWNRIFAPPPAVFCAAHHM